MKRQKHSSRVKAGSARSVLPYAVFALIFFLTVALLISVNSGSYDIRSSADCTCGAIFDRTVYCGDVHDNTSDPPDSPRYCRKFLCTPDGWTDIGYATHEHCAQFRQSNNISLPKVDTGNPYCGDGICSNGESMVTCSKDCGEIIRSSVSKDTIEKTYQQRESSQTKSGQYAKLDPVRPDAPQWWIGMIRDFFVTHINTLRGINTLVDGTPCLNQDMCARKCRSQVGYYHRYATYFDTPVTQTDGEWRCGSPPPIPKQDPTVDRQRTGEAPALQDKPQAPSSGEGEVSAQDCIPPIDDGSGNIISPGNCP